MGLKKKYILITTFLLSVMIGLFLFQNFELKKKQIRTNYKERVEQLTEIITNGLKIIMLEERREEFQKFLERLITGEIEAVRMFSEDGIILNSFIPGEIGKKIDQKDLQVYRLHKDSPVFMHEREGKKVFSQIKLIKNEWPCQKCHDIKKNILGILNVEISTQGTEQKIADTRKWIIISSIITIIIILIVIVLLSIYLIKRPVAEIVDSLKRFEEGDQKVRIVTKRKDEIGMLAARLNSIISELSRSKEEIDKYYKEEIRYIEKMAYIGEVSTTIVHEIKNPIAGISGALQVLAEDFTSNSPHREIINEILSELERININVKDLLFFAKPPELNLIIANINDIIEKVKKAVDIPAKKLNVKINLLSDRIPEIPVDPEQLEKAFLNIAHNALNSMPGGGTLTIASHDKSLDNEIEIAFSDTGKGIPEENLKDIFKPEISGRYFGTGLGLAISRNIIENHNGRIDVESRLGIGSTFHIILPQKRSI